MTDEFVERMRDAAAVLGCRIVILPPYGSDAEPVEIEP